MGRFTEELFDLQRAIRTENGDKLLNYFTHTRSIRRGIIEAGQDIEAPNFGRDIAVSYTHLTLPTNREV